LRAQFDKATSVAKLKAARDRQIAAGAELAQMVMAGELHCYVAGEPIRALHNDCADAIAGYTVQHSREAWTLCNGVRAS
jgi:hypothetical protein